MAWILLGLIWVAGISAVVYGPKRNWPTEIYYFTCFSLLLLSLVYGISILDWHIGSSDVDLKRATVQAQQARADALATQKQMILISTSAIELTGMTVECSSRPGGCAGATKKEILRRQKTLLAYIDGIEATGGN